MEKTEDNYEKLKICNDSAIDNAELFNFKAYVNAFEEIITNAENETPFSIVINGRWGSGKTSLMRTLREQVKENSGHDGKRKIQTVWFNAWKYSDTDQLLASLVREIFAEMKKSNRWKSLVSEYPEKIDIIQQISDLVNILTAGQGPDLTKWRKIPEYEKLLPFYDNFQEYLQKAFEFFELGKKPDKLWNRIQNKKNEDNFGALVIFIDDLDRCSPKAITNVLETVNLFFDQPGCIFVLGMDMRFITMAIENQYKDFDGFSGKDYLDKMIQVRFDLPGIPNDKFLAFIRDNLQDYKYRSDSFDLILTATDSNPRKCKQFVNSIKLMISLDEFTPEIQIDRDLLVKWLSLNYRFPKFIEEIKMQPDLIETFQKCSLMEQEELEKWCGEDNKTIKDGPVPYYRGIVKKYIEEAALFTDLKKGKKFTAGRKAASNITNYIYLSAVSPVNTNPLIEVIEAEIDKGPFINRPDSRILGRYKPRKRYYIFYHFVVPEGTPEWNTYFSTSFLVNGQLVEERKFLPGNLNGEDYGMYEYEFSKEGDYEIEIRGANSVKATLKVKNGAGTAPARPVTRVKSKQVSEFEKKAGKK